MPPPPHPPSGMPEGTRIESVEEIRAALKEKRIPTVQVELAAPETKPFRPIRRPPAAMLCVFYDGQSEGDWHCLRADETTIGRTHGDILIPYDSLMSAQHMQIVRQTDAERSTWNLVDLDSTNGTFVRVGSAVLKHGSEVYLGSRRYRYEVPQTLAPAGEPAGDALRSGTQSWSSPKVHELFPALVEIQLNGDGPRFPLSKPDCWIGRDRGTCAVAVPDDPFLNTPHARIHRDERGRWTIENLKSLNGVWLRIERLPVASNCLFQLGEQRFLLRIGPS